MTTTRRYPRTSAEAFRGLDYACAIERPARMADRMAGLAVKALALAALAVAVLLLAGCAFTGSPLDDLSAPLVIHALCGLVGLAAGVLLCYLAQDPTHDRYEQDGDAGDTQADWPSRAGGL
jgi:hypothetical protein